MGSSNSSVKSPSSHGGGFSLDRPPPWRPSQVLRFAWAVAVLAAVAVANSLGTVETLLQAEIDAGVERLALLL